MKNPERERFILAFGYLFIDTSPTMQVKCWRRIRTLPDPLRIALIEALWNIAHGKSIGEP